MLAAKSSNAVTKNANYLGHGWTKSKVIAVTNSFKPEVHGNSHHLLVQVNPGSREHTLSKPQTEEIEVSGGLMPCASERRDHSELKLRLRQLTSACST